MAGVFSSRVTTIAAFVTVMVGSTIGIFRFAMELIFKSTPAESANWFVFFFAKMHYLYFGVFLYVICTITIILVTLVTKQHNYEQVRFTSTS